MFQERTPDLQRILVEDRRSRLRRDDRWIERRSTRRRDR
jgi:hypothetical protein